jgi:hypothetical protein
LGGTGSQWKSFQRPKQVKQPMGRVNKMILRPLMAKEKEILSLSKRKTYN